MRRKAAFGFAWAFALLAFSPSDAHAQLGAIGGGVGADPFSFYYGYYLPHAQYMASQPTPLDAINRVTVNRQAASATDRTELYDPVSPYGAEEELDPLRPYNGKASARAVRPRGFSAADVAHTKGSGPVGYYNRTYSQTAQYFPGLRTGRGPNHNLAPVNNRRGAAIGSMPQAPSAGGLQTR